MSAPYGGMENDQVTTERADRERTQAARIAAHASWAVTPDREVRTRPARAAFLARFERQVDPDNLLSPRNVASGPSRPSAPTSRALRSSRPRSGVAKEHARRPEHGHREALRDNVPPFGVTFPPLG